MPVNGLASPILLSCATSNRYVERGLGGACRAQEREVHNAHLLNFDGSHCDNECWWRKMRLWNDRGSALALMECLADGSVELTIQ